MSDTLILKNQQDYLNQIQSDLQKKLGIKDTKLINTGPLSVLANTLANVAFDAKKYYEYVTSEFNVATAQRFKSMLFHASVYSYNFNLAEPAHVTIKLKIPRTEVPSHQKIKYQVPAYTEFNLNGVPFRIENEVLVEIDSNNISAKMIIDKMEHELNIIEGVSEEDNLPIFYILIPEDQVTQLERRVEKFVVPAYQISDNVTFNVEIPKESQIHAIRAYVNSYENLSISANDLQNLSFEQILYKYQRLKELQIKYFKFNASASDDVIFANIIDPQQISFTLGNGVYGRKLNTNDELFIVVDFCKGAKGNIYPGMSQIKGVNYYVIDTYTNDTINYSTTVLKLETDVPASGGKDVSDIEDIRFGILKKITERESLLTELDFAKYFADPYSKQLATVTSRQLSTMPPVVTVYGILRDPYDYSIIPTTTVNLIYEDHFKDKPWTINPELDYDNGTKIVSPFVYINQYGFVDSYFKYDDYKIPLVLTKLVSHPELVLDLHVRWNPEDEHFYFECNNLNYKEDDTFHAIIHSNVGDYVLNEENGFKAKIESNNMLYGRFFKEPLSISDIKVYNETTHAYIHVYNIADNITIMEQIQRHMIYDFGSNKQALFVPFIDKTFYKKFTTDPRYVKQFRQFFRISEKETRSKLAYNIVVNQTFINTISVDNITKKGVIKNENDQLLAKYPVKLTIDYNYDLMHMKGLTLFDVESAIKLAIFDHLFNVESNKIEYYETTLVRNIKDLFPDIIRDVFIESPKTLVMQDWNTILHLNKLSVEEQLVAVPTYFHFDLTNVEIKALSNY